MTGRGALLGALGAALGGGVVLFINRALVVADGWPGALHDAIALAVVVGLGVLLVELVLAAVAWVRR